MCRGGEIIYHRDNDDMSGVGVEGYMGLCDDDNMRAMSIIISVLFVSKLGWGAWRDIQRRNKGMLMLLR